MGWTAIIRSLSCRAWRRPRRPEKEPDSLQPTPPPSLEGDPVGLCMAGFISPEVALSRLLLGHVNPDGIAALLAQRRPEPPTQRWQALAALLEARRPELVGLSAEVVRAGSDHARPATDPLTGAAEIAGFLRSRRVTVA